MSDTLSEYEKFTSEARELYGNRSLVLYRHGAFFNIYSNGKPEPFDIHKAAFDMECVVTRKKASDLVVTRENWNTAGFPYKSLDDYTDKLISKGWIVVIVDQIVSYCGGKKIITRNITEVLDKGTHITSLTQENKAIYVYFDCRKFKGTRIIDIGICIFDVAIGSLDIYQIQNDCLGMSRSSFDDLLLLAKNFGSDPSYFHNPSSPCWEYPSAIAISNVILSAPLRKKLISDTFISEGCGLADSDSVIGLNSDECGYYALAIALDDVKKKNPLLVKHLPLPKIHTSSDGITSLSRGFSDHLQLDLLFQQIQQCKTACGKRYFKRRFEYPLSCIEMIQQEHQNREKYKDNYKDIREKLDGMIDVDKFYKLLITKKVAPRDFSRFYETLIKYQNLNLENCDKLISDIKSTLDIVESSKYRLDNIETNFFSKGKSPEFEKLSLEMKEIEDEIRSFCSSIHESAKHQTKKTSITIKLPLGIWENIKSQIIKSHPDIIFQISPSAKKVALRTKRTIKLNEKYFKLLLPKLKDQLLVEFSIFCNDILENHGENIRKQSRKVEIVDWYTTILYVSENLKMTKPILVPSSRSFCKFSGLRNLVVEKHNTQIEYVKNDLSLGTDDEVGILVYGINGIGKSSISRAVGMCVLMAQVGFDIPSDEMTICPYEYIGSRGVCGDDTKNNKSTLFVEAGEISDIIRFCGPKSLFIGDELCSGTDSDSAISMVAGVVCKLVRSQTSFLFATHLHGVTDLDVIRNLVGLRICHLSFDFDSQTRSFVYNRKLEDGCGKRSYGLEVFSALGMDLDVMEVAYSIRSNSPKVSRYNTQYILDVCEICKTQPTSDTHHIIPQATIKNNKESNIIGLCGGCHDSDVHNTTIVKVQTSKGVELIKSSQPTKKSRSSSDDLSLLKTKILDGLQKKKTKTQLSKELGITAYMLQKALKA